jgi:hypothetical protein
MECGELPDLILESAFDVGFAEFAEVMKTNETVRIPIRPLCLYEVGQRWMQFQAIVLFAARTRHGKFDR